MNYYELLGVKETASKDEIKRAYVINAETNGEKPSKEMKQALLILTDPLSRIQYDRALALEQSTSPILSLGELKKLNYYKRLKIDIDSNQESIKKGYYEQIKIFFNELYPDHFILIREAYDVLSDPVERKKYSLHIEQEQSTQSSSNNQEHQPTASRPPISLEKLKKMNYFERLNVNQYASTEKIKECYYNQIKQFNNELFPDHFLLIKEAYEYLSNPTRRNNYINELNSTTSHQQTEPSFETRSMDEYSEKSAGYPSLGWIIAIFGSFLFTPVIAIPLGIAVGIGFARAFKAVGMLIVVGIILLFLIALFS